MNNFFLNLYVNNINVFPLFYSNFLLGSFFTLFNNEEESLHTYVRDLISNVFSSNPNYNQFAIEKKIYHGTLRVPYFNNQQIIYNFGMYVRKHKTLSTVPIPLNVNSYDVSSSSLSSSSSSSYILPCSGSSYCSGSSSSSCSSCPCFCPCSTCSSSRSSFNNSITNNEISPININNYESSSSSFNNSIANNEISPININNYESSSSSNSDYEEEGSIASLYSSPFSNFNKLFYKKFPSSVFLKSSYTYSSIEDQYFIREELTSLERRSLKYEKMNNDLTVLEIIRENRAAKYNEEASRLFKEKQSNQELLGLVFLEENSGLGYHYLNNPGPKRLEYRETSLKYKESFKVNNEKIKEVKKLDLLIEKKEDEVDKYLEELEDKQFDLCLKINNEAQKQFNKRISNGSIRRITDVNENWIIGVNRKSFTNSFMYNNFYKDYPKQNIMKITS